MPGLATRLGISALFLLSLPSFVLAQNDEPISFENETINLIIPNGAGGGSDLQGRLVARHISKHLPGNPNVVVQNIPGGGGVKAMIYFNEINPETDPTIIMVSSSMPFRTRSGKISESVFDPRKIPWIGSASDSTNFCAFSTSTVKDRNELSENEYKVGATAISSQSYAIYQILNRSLGWKLKTIIGYENGPTRVLALERSEIDGICSSMESFVDFKPLIESGGAKFVLYMGPHKRDDLDAPYLLDLIDSPAERDFADSALSSISFGRPYALHPSSDPRLLPIFRDAFAATLQDPEFIEEAERIGVFFRYTSGQEIETETQKLYATSQKTISEIAEIYAE